MSNTINRANSTLDSAEWTVVPHSGTSGLARLRGSGSLHSELGQGGELQFDYSLGLEGVANAN